MTNGIRRWGWDLNRAKTVLLTSLRGLRLVGFKSSCTAPRSRSFAQKRWGWDLNPMPDVLASLRASAVIQIQLHRSALTFVRAEAVGLGFEPRRLAPPVFKTGAMGRSATPPR